jgi:hypothetical protein
VGERETWDQALRPKAEHWTKYFVTLVSKAGDALGRWQLGILGPGLRVGPTG